MKFWQQARENVPSGQYKIKCSEYHNLQIQYENPLAGHGCWSRKNPMQWALQIGFKYMSQGKRGTNSWDCTKKNKKRGYVIYVLGSYAVIVGVNAPLKRGHHLAPVNTISHLDFATAPCTGCPVSFSSLYSVLSVHSQQGPFRRVSPLCSKPSSVSPVYSYCCPWSFCCTQSRPLAFPGTHRHAPTRPVPLPDMFFLLTPLYFPSLQVFAQNHFLNDRYTDQHIYNYILHHCLSKFSSFLFFSLALISTWSVMYLTCLLLSPSPS